MRIKEDYVFCVRCPHCKRYFNSVLYADQELSAIEIYFCIHCKNKVEIDVNTRNVKQ